MLSNYTYSKYAINKGYNDDIKLIAPYYFELISTPRELERGYWEFEDCKVRLESSYLNIITKDKSYAPVINYWKQVYTQEKPFKQSDNKWYFVIWRGDKGHDWRIAKFKHAELKGKVIDVYNKVLYLRIKKKN